ncbi:hypothetical protein [Cellulomonas soli]|uniref:Uncharacterized protein n=1 Tax=Cellulomonas soli TaxID=931535 RepID=A0A512PAX5_9CELL|nr:hypothetical protein [Cellulomonas soli]NYI57365.1 hypothetical protein [Cellulomonas soli]GEP68355.1 hypothetical protein CSO01_10700 [Cellulomonas soli]
MSRVPTSVLAALTLVVGFAVARGSDLRALGGLVLLAGLAWCLVREWRRTAWWRLALVVLAGALCFVASHVLADPLGAWPSVLLCAGALGLVTVLLVDHPRRRARPVDGRPLTRGERVTEWLLTFVGPAQLGDPRRPVRRASPVEQAREQDLRTNLVREVGPDGRTYLVERADPDR